MEIHTRSGKERGRKGEVTRRKGSAPEEAMGAKMRDLSDTGMWESASAEKCDFMFPPRWYETVGKSRGREKEREREREKAKGGVDCRPTPRTWEEGA